MSQRHHHADERTSERRLALALSLNLLLTVLETVAGILTGSLALVADALHNLGDCGSFAIALIARRVARWPSDELRTFGYRRAEIIGGLLNLTILIVTSLYLFYEAAVRLTTEQTINGRAVVAVAAVALVVNLVTAALLYTGSRHNLNIRAAYLHNLADSFSSLGVIVAGVAIIWLGITWMDSLVTVLVAGFILRESLPDVRRSIHILMEGAPTDIETAAVIAELQGVDGVAGIHHVHLWEIDEHHRAIEAHVVVDPGHQDRWTIIKRELKLRLGERFHIHHSTLEFEAHDEAACAPCPPPQHHPSC